MSKFTEYVKKEDSVFRFFYNLRYQPIPNKDEDINWPQFWWVIKACIGYSFFYLHGKQAEAFTFLTKYFPFSLFFRTSFVHHDNIQINSFLRKIEEVVRKEKIEILILNGIKDTPYTEFSGIIDEHGRRKKVVLQELEDILQKEYGPVIVRNVRGGFKLFFPTSDLPA